MSQQNLNIFVLPTYSTLTLAVADGSKYNPNPPSSPTLEISAPGFDKVIIPFQINNVNILNSTSLGITSGTDALVPLPDGIYQMKYSVAPAYFNNIERTIFKVDNLQERFDEAFLKLEMMECDRAIKTQQKVDLNSIYFFIQGAIAAANNCAVADANKLYNQAQKMLNNFMKNGCQCSGTNYVTNFY
jgi:hypothetical protein